MHQPTPFSMPRGKFVEADPLCGPVGISRLGKPWTIMPRKVEGPSRHLSNSFALPVPVMSIASNEPVMASKPVE
jgi:hypothetical protein